MPGTGTWENDHALKEDSVSVASTNSSQYRDPMDGTNPADRSSENHYPWVPLYTAETDIYLRSVEHSDENSDLASIDEPTAEEAAIWASLTGQEERLAKLQSARIPPFSNRGAIPKLVLPEALRDDPLFRLLLVDNEGAVAAVADWTANSLVVPEWRAAIDLQFLWGRDNPWDAENICKKELRELYHQRMREGFKGQNSSWSVFEKDWSSFVESELRNSEVDGAQFTKKALDALWVMMMMDIDLLILAFETMDDYDLAVELIEWDRTRLKRALHDFIFKVERYLVIFADKGNSPEESLKKLLATKGWTRIKTYMFFEKGPEESDSEPEDETEYSDGSEGRCSTRSRSESIGVDSAPGSTRSLSPSVSTAD